VRLSAALALLLHAAGGAVALAGGGDAPSRFPVSTASVAVDLVVRDRHGALERGLTPADIELFEDGVRQDVTSVQLVDAAAPGGTASAYVAFAFDRLGPAARAFARQSLLEFLGSPSAQRAQLGLFAIDGRVATLTPFTQDLTLLRRGVERLTSRTPRSFAGAREREEVRNAFAGQGEGGGQAHVASADEAGVPECRGMEAAQVSQAELLAARMTSFYQSLEQDEQGMATVHALLALIGSVQPLPGRKAVVVFSEGLQLSGRAEAALHSVIDAAHRANVVLYTVDAGGLRVASGSDETRRTVESIRTSMAHEVADGPVSAGGSSLPGPTSMVQLERNEDALRFAPGSGLSELAAESGGFLIQGTNDLAPRLAEVADDLRSYYVVSYTPGNGNFDGRFRSISVRVKRPHARLSARAGYLALRTPLPVPTLEHEAAALARLESGPSPNAVPLHLLVLQFPEKPPRSRVPILVEVPADALRFDVDEKHRVYRQDFTVLVLIRDRDGAVVGKLSQRYALERPLSELAAARRGRVLFYRETQLPAGDYTVQAVAYDARAGRAGSASQRLGIPPSDENRLHASSLMIVGGVRKLARGDAQAAAPLRYHDLLLVPNLGEPLRRTAGEPLAFSITAWSAAPRNRVDATVEVLRDGHEIAASRATPLEPDGDGLIRMVSSVPTDRFQPGRYELRVTLSDGRDTERRSQTVSIGP
jgi:VWFA-related protein